MKIGTKIVLFGGIGAALTFLFSRNAHAASGWAEGSWPKAQGPNPEPSSLEPGTYITSAQRDEMFGPIEYFPSPSSTNPERIVITNQFSRDMLVRRTYPELPGNPTIDVHREAAEPLRTVLEDLEERGMLGLIRSFDGSYNPRLVRGSTTSLSAHAYGTAIDVNASENPMGHAPTEDQRRLAAIFESHGWYWGDRFSRRDPMHFEWIGST